MLMHLLSLINVPISVLIDLFIHETSALGQEGMRATYTAQVGEVETEEEKIGFGEEDSLRGG